MRSHSAEVLAWDDVVWELGWNSVFGSYSGKLVLSPSAVEV